jgi:hypothetical protein
MNVAAASEATYYVVARVHARVDQATPKSAERSAPVALSRADVEYRLHGAPQRPLRGGEYDHYLPPELLGRLHSMARMAVPLVEV